MLSSIYPLVAVYFVIGAIAIAFINKKKVQNPEELLVSFP